MWSIQLEVISEDQSANKWRVPLKEDIFGGFIEKGGSIVQMVFDNKSLFGPFLFKNFFDPSDAFPLWEFEPGVVLSDLQKPCVDWSQTEECYVLKSEIPNLEKSSCFRVFIESGKVMEISGLWKHKNESKTRDWRSGKWWEHGFVRRLELPENTDWKKIEAYMKKESILEIKLPKISLECTH